jgi:hypothetical protein
VPNNFARVGVLLLDGASAKIGVGVRQPVKLWPLADGAIGVDTHADTHVPQIAGADGVPSAECTIANNEDGFAEAVAFAARLSFAVGVTAIGSLAGPSRRS